MTNDVARMQEQLAANDEIIRNGMRTGNRDD